MSFFTLLHANVALKLSCSDVVDMTGQDLCSTHSRKMGVDKPSGLRPAEELGCLRGWETSCQESLNIVIVLSQQRERI